MAILRCNTCSHMREVRNDYIGKSVSCPKCKNSTPIHDTVIFVEKVIEKYHSVSNRLRQIEKQTQTQLISSKLPEKPTLPADVDIFNTTAMTQKKEYEPILQWFKQKKIQLNINHKALDTTGFFDEIALALGEKYDVLKEITDRIKRTQNNNYTSVTLNLSKHSQKDTKTIISFCEELYEYAFVSKYFYKKKDKRVHLTLQTIPGIINFFNGEWLEWFVFMKILTHFHEKKVQYACLRSFKINFPNEDIHELDVFFINQNNIPVYIECKSGEFRSEIDKYIRLRKRLSINPKHFLILVLGLSDKQAQGLSSMYDMTFVNEHNFMAHLPLE
ncbi:hypothetical protein [Candidatus Venteria ishoeyi]|uniref:Uncharacterized protein n=1 Tax=Candidatus Venteria ishoeyi TaxID=1899563 RepID=A0A1H6FA71_9GAMM|nr:hypothetical protein [Candidatus Venteria ishoeyi]MDM8545022.1 hypothetical protein [Candidatus Venteria ishoeyi]SEH07010.1 Uncharacterised protein [Candidatus Venteria ishoeyi]